MSYLKQESTTSHNNPSLHLPDVLDLCSSDDSLTESETPSSDLPTSGDDYMISSSDDDSSSDYSNTNNYDENNNNYNTMNTIVIPPESDNDDQLLCVSPESVNHKINKTNNNNSVSINKNKKKNNRNRTSSKKQKSKIKIIDNDEIRDKFSEKVYKSTRKAIRDLYGKKIEKLTAQHYTSYFQRPPQQLMKQTNLMLARRYARTAGWSEQDGFREMIQNWFDGCNTVSARISSTQSKTIIIPIIHNQNMCYHYFAYKSATFDIEDNLNNELIGSIILKKERKQMVLKLCNYGIALDANQIIMGQTSKTNGKAVGKFGEGLKMGACILLYYNHTFSILTNTKNWKFSFKKSKSFNTKTMYVSPHQKQIQSPAQVIVTIRNIQKEIVTLDSIVNKIKQINICHDIERRYFFPLYHPKINEYIKIKPEDRFGSGLDGDILIGEYYKNKVYHNGFYIGSYDNCYFGYNINGNMLPLNRDRGLTSRALQTLHDQIPRYWKYAINKNSKVAVQYLQCINNGKSNREFMELHPSYLDVLLNKHTATKLFNVFITDLLQKNEENEEKQDLFVVANDIDHDQQEKVLKELKRKPYKINKYLYDIFLHCPKFETLELALEKQLNILLNAPKAELCDIKRDFIKWYVNKMEILFPQLKEYKIQFKETIMDIGCRIIEKQIIFKAELLDDIVVNKENYDEKKLFVELCRSLTNELKQKHIISKDEFEEVMFSGCYRQIQFQSDAQNKHNEIQQRLEMEKNEIIEMEREERKNDQKLIENQAKQIEELRNKLICTENEENEENKINVIDDEIDDIYNDDYGGYNFGDFEDDNPRDDWNMNSNENENENQNEIENNNDVNEEQSGRKRKFDAVNECDDDVMVKKQKLNDGSSLMVQSNEEEKNIKQEKEENEIIETLTNRIDELEMKLTEKESKIDAQQKEINELNDRLQMITEVANRNHNA